MSLINNQKLDDILKENNLSLSNKKFSDLRYIEGAINENYYVVKKDLTNFGYLGFYNVRSLVIENVEDKTGSKIRLYIHGATTPGSEEKVQDLENNYFLLQNELVLPKGYKVHDRNVIKDLPMYALKINQPHLKDMYAFKLVKKKSEENKNLEYNNSDKYFDTPYKLTIIDKDEKDDKGKKVLCVTNVYGCINKFEKFEELFKEYVSGYKPKTDKKGGTRRRRGSKGGSRKNRRSRKSM
jgi:hypothetical protein